MEFKSLLSPSVHTESFVPSSNETNCGADCLYTLLLNVSILVFSFTLFAFLFVLKCDFSFFCGKNCGLHSLIIFLNCLPKPPTSK